MISHEYVMPFAWIVEHNTNGMKAGGTTDVCEPAIFSRGNS